MHCHDSAYEDTVAETWQECNHGKDLAYEETLCQGIDEGSVLLLFQQIDNLENSVPRQSKHRTNGE